MKAGKVCTSEKTERECTRPRAPRTVRGSAAAEVSQGLIKACRIHCSLTVSSSQCLIVSVNDPGGTPATAAPHAFPSTCLLCPGCGPVREDYPQECRRGHILKQERRTGLRPRVYDSCPPKHPKGPKKKKCKYCKTVTEKPEAALHLRLVFSFPILCLSGLVSPQQLLQVSLQACSLRNWVENDSLNPCLAKRAHNESLFFLTPDLLLSFSG